MRSPAAPATTMQLSSARRARGRARRTGDRCPTPIARPQRGTEHHAVLEQHVQRAEAEQDPAREREERHADVVGEDLRTRSPTARRRDARGSRPASAAAVTDWYWPGTSAARRARIAPRPVAAEQRRQRRGTANAISDEPVALADAAPVPVRSKNSRNVAARSARVVHRCAGRARTSRSSRPTTRIAGKAPAREREVGRRRAVVVTEPAHTVGAEARSACCPAASTSCSSSVHVGARSRTNSSRLNTCTSTTASRSRRPKASRSSCVLAGSAHASSPASSTR